ncbi:DNRLRE domain-containing protein [Sphaerisporangium sp. NPDC049002]|uniref:DNRLRE domain-containing protein n=1 Tax=Sphaerisporangium sp. NPDC049002 TaxID=3155392 RepID=UPI0033CE4951
MHTSSASQRRSILTKGQHRRLAIAALTASSLLASLLSAGTASAQTEPSPHPKGSDQSAAQSELTEAVEQAKSTGKPVQLPSLTTETSTSEVTPAGKITTRITSGPVRVKDANGNWQKIDTDLERSGNTLQPKAAKADIKFSGGGSGPFAEFRRSDGTSLSLGWEGQLPQPAIEGNKAIYRGVAGEGAGDLVATALPTGLRFDVVLNRKPTSPVEVHIPITPQGLTLGDNEGNLKVSDSAGEVIAISSKPAMWDSNASNKGLTSRIGHLAAIRHGRSGPITSKVIDKTGGKVFVLKPSMDFLNDPETTYPVTVDPSVALPLNGDTDVDSENDWNNVDGEYLTAGTQGTQKSRIYLAFDTRGLPAITSAQLSLTNFDAPSCGATVGAGIQVRRITGFWHADTQTWTPQPTNTTDGAVTNTAGIDSTCATWPGQMTWNVTTIVSAWASGTAPNHGLVLQSPTETTSNNYRVFTSSENTDDFGPPPTLTVTSDTVFIPGEGEDPADPGPEDFRPGQVDVDTGSWVISGIDVFEDGLVTTRSHSAGQRTDVARPNEAVLGPNWRLEPLGGILRSRLVDNSSNGYLQFVYSTGTESVRFLANQAQPGTFTGDDGATIVKNADGTFTQSGGEFQITLVWTQVGSEYLITSLGAADTGMQTISYDTQGRVTRLVSPATQGVCPTPDAPGCASVTFQYATATTATTSQLGDVAGQVKSISYDAPGGTCQTC